MGQFAGAHVVFHSKLKKPVMAKRASTCATLSVVQSISNLPNTPSPTTPKTPIYGEGSIPSRPSSKKMVGIDDTLVVSENGRNSRSSSIGQGWQVNSTVNSPTPSFLPNYGSQEVKRLGGPHNGTSLLHFSLAHDEGEGKGSLRKVGLLFPVKQGG